MKIIASEENEDVKSELIKIGNKTFNQITYSGIVIFREEYRKRNINGITDIKFYKDEKETGHSMGTKEFAIVKSGDDYTLTDYINNDEYPNIPQYYGTLFYNLMYNQEMKKFSPFETVKRIFKREQIKEISEINNEIWSIINVPEENVNVAEIFSLADYRNDKEKLTEEEPCVTSLPDQFDKE